MATINFETFEKHISDIRRMDDLRQSLGVLSEEHGFNIEFPTLIDNVVDLLENLMDDKDDLVGRWIFEWNFGREADDPDLSTVEGLWARLTENK